MQNILYKNQIEYTLKEKNIYRYLTIALSMYASVLSNSYFPFWFDPILVGVDRFGPKLRSDLKF